MVRNLAAVLLAMTALVLIVSLIHVDRFKPGAPTWIWLAAFALGALTSGVGLIRLRNSGRDEAVTSAADPTAPAT
jgi:hypothetical protein